MNSPLSATPSLVRSVLHPTDFSPASDRAFVHALAIALFRETRFTILHVGEHSRLDWAEFPPVRLTLERWNLLTPGCERTAVFDELGIRVAKLAVPGLFTAAAIGDYLERDPHDLVVLATAGRNGLARWLRGSVAERVARSSHTMTLFVPADARRNLVSLADGDLTLASVLVPVDHHPKPGAALEFACRVAEGIGDKRVPIVVLHVGDPDSRPSFELKDGETWAFERVQRAGDPVEQILAMAEETGANLIVMPTAGRDGFLDAMRGSTTERVLRRAPCPVLAVPSDD
jgi:nucleotide-binding universal stress UspA family protein